MPARRISNPSRRCKYPQSHSLAGSIKDALDSIAANRSRCSRFYLDTVESMSSGGEDHHQGLARTHRLSDGTVYFFLTHSDVDSGRGILAQFRYSGPLDQDHVLETSPLTVAPMEQLLRIDDQHPSDIAFLPDVNDADAGYLFVTKEYDKRRVTVYRWAPGHELAPQGQIFQGFPSVLPGDPSSQGGPNFLFIDRADDIYYLGIASSHWGWGQLLRAPAESLFPGCKQGSMNVSAFVPEAMFPFPVTGGPSQVKLIRDGSGNWYLLTFRSDPSDDEHGADYVDVYGVRFAPFCISYLLYSVHIFFRPGDTGFANTGTHYVEASGRLLVSSSYRWAEDEGPGSSSYVSRVDECPSS
jgi:hypothetical protein